MIAPNKSSYPLLDPSATALHNIRMLDAWDVLERFGQDLQGSENPREQVRLLLQAVRDSMQADAAFFYSGADDEPILLVSAGRIAPDWCRDLGRRVLTSSSLESFRSPGGGEILRARWLQTPEAVPLDPASLALVRISRSRSTWVVAVRFRATRPFEAADLKPMMLARRIFLNHHRHSRLHNRLKDTLFGLIRCLTEAIDAKDPYTRGHSERVARIASRLGRQMNLPANAVSDTYLAGLLHDVGKIGIRDNVLQKPGALTEQEAAHIQEHTVIGDKIVANVPQLQHLRPGVRNHHEHYDGSGYPDGLAGPSIPLLARILAVADACDAMMADRPYRSALPPARIDAILLAGAGKQWDAEVVQHFLRCRHELYRICQPGSSDSITQAVENAMSYGAEESHRWSLEELEAESCERDAQKSRNKKQGTGN
jgi:HD-GYP domain-containing protein (c-di-GMP phosphodiesterase class II)